MVVVQYFGKSSGYFGTISVCETEHENQ